MCASIEFCSSIETLADKVSMTVSSFTCDKDGNKLFELKPSPFVIVENDNEYTLWDDADTLQFRLFISIFWIRVTGLLSLLIYPRFKIHSCSFSISLHILFHILFVPISWEYFRLNHPIDFLMVLTTVVKNVIKSTSKLFGAPFETRLTDINIFISVTRLDSSVTNGIIHY